MKSLRLLSAVLVISITTISFKGWAATVRFPVFEFYKLHKYFENRKHPVGSPKYGNRSISANVVLELEAQVIKKVFIEYVYNPASSAPTIQIVPLPLSDLEKIAASQSKSVPQVLADLFSQQGISHIVRFEGNFLNRSMVKKRRNYFKVVEKSLRVSLFSIAALTALNIKAALLGRFPNFDHLGAELCLISAAIVITPLYAMVTKITSNLKYESSHLAPLAQKENGYVDGNFLLKNMGDAEGADDFLNPLRKASWGQTYRVATESALDGIVKIIKTGSTTVTKLLCAGEFGSFNR